MLRPREKLARERMRAGLLPALTAQDVQLISRIRPVFNSSIWKIGLSPWDLNFKGHFDSKINHDAGI